MTHVLVPVAVLDGETISPGLIEALGGLTVTVLGYHEVPEQTPPEQAREQFIDRATEILDNIAAELEAEGATAYHRMVFTKDLDTSVKRVAAEIESEATLIVRPTPEVEEIYVAIGSEKQLPVIGAALESLVTTVEADIFLRFFVDEERATDESDGERILAQLTDMLTEAGVSPERIDTAVQAKKIAVGPIVADAQGRGVDLVVLSDSGLSLAEIVFGDIEERIANQLLAPVLVVRPADTVEQEEE